LPEPTLVTKNVMPAEPLAAVCALAPVGIPANRAARDAAAAAVIPRFMVSSLGSRVTQGKVSTIGRAA
jgi:hypothetical protein